MNLAKGSFIYHHLRGQIGDVLREQSKVSQRNNSWVLKNKLPTQLVLYVEKYLSGDPIFFTELKPSQTIKFPPNTFADRDQLYTYVRVNGRLIPFLQPYMFREIRKTIYLGGVEYSSNGGNNQVKALNWDIRGIWIHNKLPFPLNVYYKGNLVAQINGNIGNTYLGGGGSTLYFDNSREGIDFGDQIEFGYTIPGSTEKKIIATIDDEQCLEMYIGTVFGNMWGPDPDNSVYRIDKPVWTGITYYRPVGRYNSVITNPYAPF